MSPLELAGMVVAFVAAIEATRRLLWLVVRGVRRGARIITTAETALPALLDIAHEFHPNSGTSLRDRVDQIHVKLDGQDARLHRIETVVATAHPDLVADHA